MQDRPLVLAHRGASHDHAEHTLGAYLAALEAGADGCVAGMLITYESTGDELDRAASRGTGVTNIGMHLQRVGRAGIPPPSAAVRTAVTIASRMRTAWLPSVASRPSTPANRAVTAATGKS